MKKVLLILNQPAYGADETFNPIRLANALTRRYDAEVTVFLMGDAVGCAIAGQKTPRRLLHPGPDAEDRPAARRTHRLMRVMPGRVRTHQGAPHRRGIPVEYGGAGRMDRRSRPDPHLLTPPGVRRGPRGRAVSLRAEERSS